MKRILLACLLALLMLIPAVPAFAEGPNDGRVIFGGDFTLESGEELDGDLAVFGGNVVLEESSLVDGDVAVIGGRARVAGKVDGDLVVFGGSVKLEPTAVIEGDLVTFGGQVERAEGAIVRGEIVRSPGFEFEGLTGLWRFRPGPYVPRWPDRLFQFFWGVFQAGLVTLALMALGVLIVLFWPQQTELVGQAIVAAPLPSLGVGFLTAIVAAALAALLAITICLLPMSFFVAVATLAAVLFGWTAVGLLVGQRLLAALKVQETNQLVAVLVGVLLISLLTAVPCLGWLFAVVVGSLGLGAVVLTRFGTMAYPPAPAPIASAEPRETG